MNIIGKIPERKDKANYDEWDIDRQHKEDDPSKQAKRSTFEVDKGRILHSAAFRRLQGKTQVLGVGERDFYRTRLTHSLEVAQIGRGIALECESEDGFRPDVDLVETICLAHDLGHPPFGHSGEEFLNRKPMQTHGGFSANAQNIRLVTLLERKHDLGGVNLCRATLDGLIKYSEIYTTKKNGDDEKFSYQDQAGLIKWVKGDNEGKSIECQIADRADANREWISEILPICESL